MGKKIKYTTIAISIMVLLSLGIYHFGGKNRQLEIPSGDAQAKWQTCKVVTGNITDQLNIGGKIKPLITEDVVSIVAGRIERTLVKEGDWVRRGQVLIELNEKDLITNVEKARIKYFKAKSKLTELESWENSPAYLTAKFQVENTKTDYAEAQRTYDENVKLYEQKAISQNDLHQSQIALMRAKIALETSKVQFADKKKKADKLALEEARAGFSVAKHELETKQDIINQKNIVAPCDGVVLFPSQPAKASSRQLSLIKNRSVTPGEVLLKIQNSKKFAVYAYLNELDVYRVSIGQRCDIYVQALPDEEFTGRITAIYPKETNERRTFFTIRCIIDQEKTSLKSGLTAEIQIILEKKTGALLIPISAVALKSDESGVFVLKNGTPVFRVIEIGVKTPNQVEVLSGVDEGQEIICQVPSVLLKP